MGWLNTILGKTQRDDGGPPGSQFGESDGGQDDDAASRVTARREMLQMVLRDTMRQHGIPSDWIECRMVAATGRTGRPGLHVNFVVKQAHDRLLGYVFAFQGSFERELARFDARAKDWLLSLGWEFQGFKAADAMPDPASWSRGGQRTAGGPASSDRAFAPTADPLATEAPKTDDDVQRDLEKLFAIRDAALADAARKAPASGDFENTRPFDDATGTPR